MEGGLPPRAAVWDVDAHPLRILPVGLVDAKHALRLVGGLRVRADGAHEVDRILLRKGKSTSVC